MIEVELPNGDIAEFPDGTAPEMMQAVLRKQFGGSQPSTAADVGMGLATGVGKGVAGLIGLPRVVSDLVDRGVAAGGEALGFKPGPARQPALMPSPGAVQGAMESVTGEFPKPQTRAGEYAQTIGEFIPGSLLGPGGAVRNVAAFGVIPGAASEAAGGATKGTALEPYARGGAALATGGLAAFLSARGNAAGAVGRAAGDIDNATLQQAEALFQEAQQLGTPITRAEAVQAVTGGATNFGNLQRVVEGQGGMRDFFSQRAAQTDAAAGRVFDQVTPVGVGPMGQPNPSTIGPAVGTAAENTINDVRGVINRASDPFYRQAASVRVPGAEMARIRNAPGWAEARDAVRNDPQLNRYVRNLPENSIGFLDEVKKYLRTQADNVAAPVNQQRNMQRSAGYGDDAELMREVAVDTSRNVPAATMSYGGRQFQQAANPYETALNIQSQAREQYLQPLLDGPLGKIASRDTTTQKAIDTLFPNNPLPNSAQEIETAVRAVSQRNPYAARQLVRAHLEMTFNEATQNLASGVNSYGGAKFAAIVRGNPQQAANLEAAVRALPNGDNIWAGFDRFATMLEAQGQRQAIGSQTAFNQEVLQDLRRGTARGEAGTMALGLGVKAPARIKDAIERWRLGDNVDQIARLLTDPNAGREFARMASVNNGAAFNASVIRLVGLAQRGAANPGQQSSGPKN
jgi:hypothetical protein